MAEAIDHSEEVNPDRYADRRDTMKTYLTESTGLMYAFDKSRQEINI